MDTASSRNWKTHGDSGQTAQRKIWFRKLIIIASWKPSTKGPTPTKVEQTSQRCHFSSQETGIAPAASVEFSCRSQPHDHEDDQVPGGKRRKQLTQNGSVVETIQHHSDFR